MPPILRAKTRNSHPHHRFDRLKSHQDLGGRAPSFVLIRQRTAIVEMEMESSAAGARGGEEDRGPSQAAARVEHGFGHWHCVARRMPAPGRSARSCRDRWRHHLARDVYHRPFTARDDDELRRLVARYGGRWKDIGRAVYGRTSRVMRRRWKEIQIRERPAAQKSGGEDIAEEPLQQGQGCYYADDDILASAFASCNLTMDAMDPWAGSLALGFACMAV